MTVKELCDRNGLVPETGDGSREVTGIYCCDLLSIVMGRAPADCVWVTVMGNLNAVAVAVLVDVACIVLAENMPLDEDARKRAEQEGVTIIRSKLPVYETCKMFETVFV
ncbi:MAG: hypothetical protein RSD07_02505 [Angelakisella sp.]